MGGCYSELNVFWRYRLDPLLTAELEAMAAARETGYYIPVTNNLIELLCGMFTTAWLVQLLVEDRPKDEGAPMLRVGSFGHTMFNILLLNLDLFY